MPNSIPSGGLTKLLVNEIALLFTVSAGNFGSRRTVINEIILKDANGNIISPDISKIRAYSSITKDVPSTWHDTNWGVANLFDSDTNYGETSSCVLLERPSTNILSSDWIRFILIFPLTTAKITNIDFSFGGTDNKSVPKKISVHQILHPDYNRYLNDACATDYLRHLYTITPAESDYSDSTVHVTNITITNVYTSFGDGIPAPISTIPGFLTPNIVAALLAASTATATNKFATVSEIPDISTALTLSDEIVAALNAANAPSANNKFATQSDIPAGPFGTVLPENTIAALAAAISAKSTNRFATMEDIPSGGGTSLSANVEAALNGAAAPSATNVFATMADIPSGGGGGSTSPADALSQGVVDGIANNTNITAINTVITKNEVNATITTLENSINAALGNKQDKLSAAILAALGGAASPSAGNVFATMTDIPDIPSASPADALSQAVADGLAAAGNLSGASALSGTNRVATLKDVSDKQDKLGTDVAAALGTSTASATNAFITQNDLASFAPAANVWTNIPTANVTSVSSNNVVINNASTELKVGSAIRFKNSGATVYSYAYVVGISVSGTSTTISLRGKMPVVSGLQSIDFADGARVIHLDIQIPGAFAAATGLVLTSVGKTYFNWVLGNAHVVAFRARSATADSGATQPTVQLNINGTTNTNLSTTTMASAWSDAPSIIPIASATAITYGQALEIDVSATGTTKDSKDLTTSIIFVLE